ncbi:MAG: hypothetical protein AAGH49_03720 [Pseudomonadota bacterium]
MTNLVPVGSRDLIFQPTESLTARVLSAEEDKTEAEKKLEESQAALEKERKKKNGANLFSMALFGGVLAAAAGAFFIWYGAESQIAKADEERRAALEARDEAVADLSLEQAKVAEQLAEIQAFDAYRPVLSTTHEIGNLELQLASYQSQLEGQPTPGLPDDIFDIEVDSTNWVVEAQERLMADQSALNEALETIRTWSLVRDRPLRLVDCLPQDPLNPGPVNPGC